MTLTLNLSPETEERLQHRSARAGLPLADLVSGIVEDAARYEEHASKSEEPSVLDEMMALGVVGSVRGRRRADGRPWSEVEAACVAH